MKKQLDKIKGDFNYEEVKGEKLNNNFKKTIRFSKKTNI